VHGGPLEIPKPLVLLINDRLMAVFFFVIGLELAREVLEGERSDKSIEHDLHTLVALFVLPVFAFANEGINILGVTADQLTHGAPMGIGLGLCHTLF